MCPLSSFLQHSPATRGSFWTWRPRSVRSVQPGPTPWGQAWLLTSGTVCPQGSSATGSTWRPVTSKWTAQSECLHGQLRLWKSALNWCLQRAIYTCSLMLWLVRLEFLPVAEHRLVWLDVDCSVRLLFPFKKQPVTVLCTTKCIPLQSTPITNHGLIWWSKYLYLTMSLPVLCCIMENP